MREKIFKCGRLNAYDKRSILNGAIIDSMTLATNLIDGVKYYTNVYTLFTLSIFVFFLG